MEQRESLELLEPESELGTPSMESKAQAVAPNAYRVRIAKSEDAPDMEVVERLAFPALFPPTRFRREVERSNTLYLLAVRDWTDEEVALGPDTDPDSEDSTTFLGKIAAIPRLPMRLLFQSVGARRTKMSFEYVAGLVGLWFVMDEAHVVIIGNRPGDRRKGIGELLLIAAIEAAITQGSRVVTLEVRSSNTAARALYYKYGFREVGVRKRYYADNNEDAVIMTTPPIQSDEYRDHFDKLKRGHAQRWGETQRQIA